MSGELFETPPDEEKALWHPHNYEVLSGQLLAPGLPDVAERALVKQKATPLPGIVDVKATG